MPIRLKVPVTPLAPPPEISSAELPPVLLATIVSSSIAEPISM